MNDRFRCSEVMVSRMWADKAARLWVGAFLGIYSLLLISTELAAQERGAVWTLDRLAAAAISGNAGLAATRGSILVEKEGVAAARGQYFPKVDAVGKLEVFPRRQRLLIQRHGFRKSNNPFETGIVNYGLEVRLPLYTSGRIENSVSLARARVEAARARFEQTRSQLLFNVASAYYTTLRLQRVVIAQKATLRSLGESLRTGRLQSGVGRISPVALVRLRTRASQARRDLAATRAALGEAIELLKLLADLPAERPIRIAGKLYPQRYGFDPRNLRARAVASRPDLAKLREDVRAQMSAVKIAAGEFGPNVNLKARYRGATGIADGITKDAGGFIVELRIPLYDGVLLAGKRKAAAQLRVLELRLRSAERRALFEVQRAILAYHSSGIKINAARRAVGQGVIAIRAERSRFAEGRGTSNDLLLAEDAYLRARMQLAAALAERQIAVAALKFATGEDPVAVKAPTQRKRIRKNK